MKRYDAIIVGTGAAGGIVAGVLAEAGKSVLLLERDRALSFSEVGRDHLRNQRLAILLRKLVRHTREESTHT